MKIAKKLALVWSLIIFAFPAALFGDNPNKPISLELKSLKRWKNSPEARAVQQGVGAMIKPRRKYPRIAEPFEGAKQYANLYKRQFLVLEAEPGDFGGFFALVVFKNYPKVLSFWLYEIDKNVFEIREIEPYVPISKIIKRELEDKELRPYWLTAVTTQL